MIIISSTEVLVVCGLTWKYQCLCSVILYQGGCDGNRDKLVGKFLDTFIAMCLENFSHVKN